jgi:AraC-like DNA-binding protein
VEHLLEQVRVGAVRHRLEEVAGHQPAALRDAGVRERRRCRREAHGQVEEHAPRPWPHARTPARKLPGETRRRALLLQVHAFIEARLGDPALSPSGVAAANYISVRYLHKLFETEQTTVADWIRRRRLERCRRDLLDPALAGRSVDAIGQDWGLTDAAHFSRVFKRRFGVPPAEYRRLQGPSR